MSRAVRVGVEWSWNPSPDRRGCSGGDDRVAEQVETSTGSRSVRTRGFVPIGARYGRSPRADTPWYVRNVSASRNVRPSTATSVLPGMGRSRVLDGRVNSVAESDAGDDSVGNHTPAVRPSFGESDPSTRRHGLPESPPEALSDEHRRLETGGATLARGVSVHGDRPGSGRVRRVHGDGPVRPASVTASPISSVESPHASTGTGSPSSTPSPFRGVKRRRHRRVGPHRASAAGRRRRRDHTRRNVPAVDQIRADGVSTRADHRSPPTPGRERRRPGGGGVNLPVEPPTADRRRLPRGGSRLVRRPLPERPSERSRRYGASRDGRRAPGPSMTHPIGQIEDPTSRSRRARSRTTADRPWSRPSTRSGLADAPNPGRQPFSRRPSAEATAGHSWPYRSHLSRSVRPPAETTFPFDRPQIWKYR